MWLPLLASCYTLERRSARSKTTREKCVLYEVALLILNLLICSDSSLRTVQYRVQVTVVDSCMSGH